MKIDRNKLSMRVALSGLANIARSDISHSRAQPCAPSAARQFVSRQGGCPAKKLSRREVMLSSINLKIPGSGAAIPSRTVIAERRSSMRGQPSTQIQRSRKITGKGLPIFSPESISEIWP